MLRSLITASLDQRLVVVLLALALILGGGLAVRDAPWDVFPEFAPPQVVIQTEAPGLSTEEVEQLVTLPIEATINGVSRLKILRSSSIPGLSVITAIFEEDADVMTARQFINERLSEAKELLPSGVQPPRMTPLAASTSRLVMLGLTSDKVSLLEMRTRADQILARGIQAVQGVARVEVFGGDVKQYQILVTPERLQQYNVTLDQVLVAARNATAFGGAGFLETTNQRLPIRQRTRLDSLADLGAVPVAYQPDGVAVTVGRVADVVIGAADKVGDATINGQPGVLLVVHKQPFANTLAVSRAVGQAIDQLQQSLPAGIEVHRDLFSQATFIERAIANLTSAIVIGCVLVTLVLVAFLFQWRTVVISLTAIPLSLLGAIIILRCFGISLNAMTLGGLAIALGEVVDDAIVDVENVLRRLLQNRRLKNPRPAYQVVLDASLEVRSAVVYASFIVMLVFLPVFFLGGLPGMFFRPLGYAYIAAILVSLLVALTVTPAMCLLLLRNVQASAEHEPLAVRLVKRAYSWLLPIVLEHSRLTIAVAAGLLVAAVAWIPFFGGELLPDFRESNVIIFTTLKPDSSLAESVRTGQHLAAQLARIPGVKSASQQIGRADLSEDTWGPNISEIAVVLAPDADYDEVLDALRDLELPGVQLQVKQFLRERIDEVLTGSTADIVIRIVGDDLDVLRTIAGNVVRAVEGVEGLADLRPEQQVDVPQIDVLLKPQSLSGYGLSVGDVNHAIQTLLRGTVVGQIYEQDMIHEVVVRAHPDVRDDPMLLGRLLIDSPANEKLPLSALASISITEAPNIVSHESTHRRMLVTCNAVGRDVASVMQEIQHRIAEQVKLPAAGYRLEFGGEYEARKEAQGRLMWFGAASLLGIFVLLYLDFKTLRLTLMVMTSVPLACVGGVAAVVLSGGNVSMGSLVGFVTVFGIAVRNGILLISHYRHLERDESMPLDGELIMRGAMERVVPILMTAGTAALGLLPLVIFGELPGNEIEHPMAVVILGGLVSSTALTLFVLPVLYQRLATRRSFSQEPQR